MSLEVRDHAVLGLSLTSCALFLGWAADVKAGEYTPLALILVTIAAILALGAIILRPGDGVERFLQQRFTVILVAIAFFSTCLATGIQLYLIESDRDLSLALLLLGAVGLLQIVNLRAARIPLFLALVITFCVVSVLMFTSPHRNKYPNIDVLVFQQSAADALRHGHDPYAIGFPNIYGTKDSTVFQDPPRFGPGTPYYGPGVVDDQGWITYGFPYPPLSLLLVMPAYLLGGDVRFAHVIAVGLSALMMAMARPGRRGALVALLFLVNPLGLFVINMGWTEPLLLFTFSLAMFCACRWRKGLPWTLGLFFATKQYTVLALPVLFVLIESPNAFKQLVKMIAKAGIVVTAITLPFFAWNPHAFIRAVVQWQLIQPFRADALSFLVWIYNLNGGRILPIWTPLLAVIPAILIARWRCPRSPSGFAAAVTLIFLTFFAFNKQAFCNYYYFVAGAALWSVAAMRGEPTAERVSASRRETNPA